MRAAWLALAVLPGLAACPGSDSRPFTAGYTVGGSLKGSRAIDDESGGRVACAVDVDPADPIDPSPVFTLSAVTATDGSRQPGLYFTVHGFHGAGVYQDGKLFVYDRATLADCTREGDVTCFSASSGCRLSLDRWELGAEMAPGVKSGSGSGTISCDKLKNVAADSSASLKDGTFTCRASDWTASRR